MGAILLGLTHKCLATKRKESRGLEGMKWDPHLNVYEKFGLCLVWQAKRGSAGAAAMPTGSVGRGGAGEQGQS